MLDDSRESCCGQQFQGAELVRLPESAFHLEPPRARVEGERHGHRAGLVSQRDACPSPPRSRIQLSQREPRLRPCVCFDGKQRHAQVNWLARLSRSQHHFATFEACALTGRDVDLQGADELCRHYGSGAVVEIVEQGPLGVSSCLLIAEVEFHGGPWAVDLGTEVPRDDSDPNLAPRAGFWWVSGL